MSAFGPCPEPPVQQRLQARERLLRYGVTMVLRPASQHRVEQANKLLLLHGQMAADRLPQLVIERLHVLLTGLDEQLSRVPPEIPPQEVEAFVNVHDARLRRRQLQSPHRE